MKRLGLDIDGVLYPWHTYMYDYVVDHMGQKLDYRNFWKESYAIYTPETWANLWGIEHLYGMFIPPQELKDLLDRLSKAYDLYYITARGKNLEFVTESWFRRNHLPCINNLVFTDDKRFSICDLEIDYYAEDQLQHAMRLENYTNVILVEQPWNEGYRDRFKTIKDIYGLERILSEWN